MTAPSFSPRSAPLELSGASRISVLVRCNNRRLASMSFPCSRDKLPGHANSNISEALEAVFRLAISFRRSILGHGNNHDRKDVGNAQNQVGELRNV